MFSFTFFPLHFSSGRAKVPQFGLLHRAETFLAYRLVHFTIFLRRVQFLSPHLRAMEPLLVCITLHKQFQHHQFTLFYNSLRPWLHLLIFRDPQAMLISSSRSMHNLTGPITIEVSKQNKKHRARYWDYFGDSNNLGWMKIKKLWDWHESSVHLKGILSSSQQYLLND